MASKPGAKKKSGSTRRIDAVSNKRSAASIPPYGDELYRMLAESSVDSIFVIDRNFRVKYVNMSGAKVLGTSPEDAAGKHLNELFRPDTAETMMRRLSRVFESGEPYLGEMTHHFPRGDFYIHASLNPIFDADGNVESLMGISRDITERKKAEEQLAGQAHLLSMVYDGVWAVDAEFRFTYWNKGAERILGWAAEEALGKVSNDLLKTRIEGASKE